MESLIINSRDWPNETQAYIDHISNLDGENGISVEDVLRAKSHYCALENVHSLGFKQVRELLCSRDSDTLPSEVLRDFYEFRFGPSNTDSIRRRFGFSNSNPIHRLLEIDSGLLKQEHVDRRLEIVYEKLKAVLDGVSSKADPQMKPSEKMGLIYDQIRENGFRIRKECITSPILEDFSAGSLDCDSSSFIVATVAHELNWPVFLASLPGHVFVRWIDDQIKINMDFGYPTEDAYYFENYGVKTLQTRTFSFDQATFLFYSNRGLSHLEITDNVDQAIEDFNSAVALDSGLLVAQHYNHLAAAKFLANPTGNFEEALRDINEAIRLKPDDGGFYCQRGLLFAGTKQHERAMEEFNKGIRLDPDAAVCYFNRGVLKLENGNYQEAVDDFAMANVNDPRKFRDKTHRIILEAQKKGMGEKNNGCACAPGAAP